jgi:hypothetical protein
MESYGCVSRPLFSRHATRFRVVAHEADADIDLAVNALSCPDHDHVDQVLFRA